MLNIEKLKKYFEGRAGFRNLVFEDISFGLDEKEFTTILAPKSSGKSTLLKVIAGIEEPDSGTIRNMSQEGILNRTDITYIPSEPSSFPWLSVEDNINEFLSYAGKNAKGEQVSARLIKVAGLEGYEKHFPDNNSRGFRFRIALACALAVQPRIILLDDIFCEMTKKTKEEIFELLKEIKIKENISFILATSNLTEAVYLSDKVLIMMKGPGRIIREIKMENLSAAEIKDDIHSELLLHIQREISELIARGNLEHNEFTFSI